ncbi:MAG: hypothetical protein FWC50_09755, partial [Planctomycetaceae bacterium]|nr:hypothetical protein [Planctomycetaceae bacterium]
NGQGSVDWPGLSRLALWTQMQILPQNVQPLQNHVTFRQCRFGFAIDASGIRLIPMTASQSYLQQQTLPLLVIDNQCGIYWPSPGHYIRHAEFLAALARPTSTLVPLTPETERLMTFLPSQPTLREFNRTPNVLNRTTAIAAPATNAGK